MHEGDLNPDPTAVPTPSSDAKLKYRVIRYVCENRLSTARRHWKTNHEFPSPLGTAYKRFRKSFQSPLPSKTAHQICHCITVAIFNSVIRILYSQLNPQTKMQLPDRLVGHTHSYCFLLKSWIWVKRVGTMLGHWQRSSHTFGRIGATQSGVYGNKAYCSHEARRRHTADLHH